MCSGAFQTEFVMQVTGQRSFADHTLILYRTVEKVGFEAPLQHIDIRR